MSTTTTTPSGHAGNGGLQKHSVGGMYPFYILRSMSHGDAPLEYSVYNLVTGSRGPIRRTYQAAMIDYYSILVRNMMHS